MDIKIKRGDTAPPFEGPTSDGSRLGLKDFLGKRNVVLYFYPKDDTPGCTKEACNFRDNLQSIREMGQKSLASASTVSNRTEGSPRNTI
jgi:peroxiredoxin Q/BCP